MSQFLRKPSQRVSHAVRTDKQTDREFCFIYEPTYRGKIFMIYETNDKLSYGDSKILRQYKPRGRLIYLDCRRDT